MVTKIETLEQEVRALSHDELAEFRAWFARCDAAQRDLQIESDVKARWNATWRPARCESSSSS